MCPVVQAGTTPAQLLVKIRSELALKPNQRQQLAGRWKMFTQLKTAFSIFAKSVKTCILLQANPNAHAGETEGNRRLIAGQEYVETDEWQRVSKIFAYLADFCTVLMIIYLLRISVSDDTGRWSFLIS